MIIMLKIKRLSSVLFCIALLSGCAVSEEHITTESVFEATMGTKENENKVDLLVEYLEATEGNPIENYILEANKTVNDYYCFLGMDQVKGSYYENIYLSNDQKEILLEYMYDYGKIENRIEAKVTQEWNTVTIVISEVEEQKATIFPNVLYLHIVSPEKISTINIVQDGEVVSYNGVGGGMPY